MCTETREKQKMDLWVVGFISMRSQSLLEDVVALVFFFLAKSFNTKQKSKARWPHGRSIKSLCIIIFRTGEYTYFLLHLIKSHSQVKCNIQQCRCAADNDARVKRVDGNYTNKYISSNKQEKSSHQSNYGSNQRFLHEGTALLSCSHLHHNTVCNINFRVYCLLEVQSMKSH